MNYTSQLAYNDPVQLEGYQFIPFRVYPDVKINDADTYYGVGPHDNLGKISQKFYNTPDFNWFIALANDIKLENTELYAGMKIRIPAFETLVSYLMELKQ
jgi:hypothetical protein